MADTMRQEQRPGTFHELEKLLSLEDGMPHERVPTDDFFSDYLLGLSSMAAHQATATGTGGTATGPSWSGAPCPSDSCTAPTMLGPDAFAGGSGFPGGAALAGGGVLPVMHMHMHTQVQADQRFVPATHQQQQQQQAEAAAAAAGAFGPGWPVSLGGGVLHAPGQPGLMMSGTAVVPLALPGMVAVGKQQQQQQQWQEEDLGGRGRNGGRAGSGRSQAGAQRQATNREAQKRYRERQKARLLEMQVTIDRLHRELQQRQTVHSTNLSLEERHYRLQAQLARAETEVECLTWQRSQVAREQRQLAGAGAEGAGAGVGGGSSGEPLDASMGEAEGGEAGAPAGDQPQQAQQGKQEVPAQQPASLTCSAAGSAVGADTDTRRNNSVGSLPAAACGGANEGVSRGADVATGGVDGTCHACASGAADGAELAAAGVSDPLLGMYGPAPPHEAFDDLLTRFQNQVARVKQFLDEHKLRMHNPSSVVLPPSMRGPLLTMVQESLGICRDLLRVDGVDVIELLQRRDEAGMGDSGALPGSMLRHKWLHVLQVLHLTAEQKQQLLLQRTAHLALMRRIYQQRQQLNMQAMSLMLLPGGGGGGSAGFGVPAPGGAADSGDGGAAGRHATDASQATKLAGVLRLIKENLRREQRASMEINSCTLSRILAPLQAALYVCEAFPLHCDALAMANVLSTMGGGKTTSGAGSAGTPGRSSSPQSSMG